LTDALKKLTACVPSFIPTGSKWDPAFFCHPDGVDTFDYRAKNPPKNAMMAAGGDCARKEAFPNEHAVIVS